MGQAMQPERLVTVKVPSVVHRELKIESAYTGKEIGDLIADAWDTYKKAYPQSWRKPEDAS
jgi:hypothetical protein